MTDQARLPRALSSPVDPTPQERELHQLTRLPHRAWCTTCVKCRGRRDYRKQVFDEKPAVEVDYAFLTSKPVKDRDGDATKPRSTILAGVDVATGMTFATVVQETGVNDYSVNEQTRFILETGRSRGVLQADQEAPAQALARAAATKTSMITQLSPAYSSRSLGAAERCHRELSGLCRVLRTAILEN